MNKSNVYIIVIKLYNKSKTLLTLDSSIDKKQKAKMFSQVVSTTNN